MYRVTYCNQYGHDAETLNETVFATVMQVYLPDPRYRITIDVEHQRDVPIRVRAWKLIKAEGSAWHKPSKLTYAPVLWMETRYTHFGLRSDVDTRMRLSGEEWLLDQTERLLESVSSDKIVLTFPCELSYNAGPATRQMVSQACESMLREFKRRR